MVYFEIRNSGYEKKLIGGIVVTGGGSQMKHITQLFEYITGMDTRVGYPTEHLASNSPIENLTSPMYSTGIGLVLKGFESSNHDIATTLGGTETKVRGTEKPKRGSFFDKLIKSTTELFSDED